MTSSCQTSDHLSLSCQVVLGFLSEADYKLVAKAIRYRVTAIKHQREKQRRLKEGEPDHTPKTTLTSSQRASAAETVARQVSEAVPMETGEEVGTRSCWQGWVQTSSRLAWSHGGFICSCTSQSNGSILFLLLA